MLEKESTKKRFDPNVIIPQLRELKRGASLIYHVGFLVKDCKDGDVAAIASVAMSLQEEKRVSLVQRRITEDCYQYIAQGRSA
jgi:hypothetical protein